MLATKAFSKLKAEINSEADGSIILKRPAGVCREVIIPRQFLDEGTVECTYTPNSETKRIEVCSGETVLTLADEIGVKGGLEFEITFVDKNTALIELVDGVLYNKNANDVGFGYNTDGKLIRDVSNVKWVTVSELYATVASRLMKFYNIEDREVQDYLYNITMRFSVDYTVCSKTEFARTGCYNSFRQKLPSWTNTISLGEFAFIVFDAEEAPARKRVLGNNATPKSVEDMTYDEQQEYYRQQAEAEERAEQAKEEAYLDSYGEDFDESDFDEFTEEDEYDGIDEYDGDFDD